VGTIAVSDCRDLKLVGVASDYRNPRVKSTVPASMNAASKAMAYFHFVDVSRPAESPIAKPIRKPPSVIIKFWGIVGQIIIDTLIMITHRPDAMLGSV
jgi:hypothetical protein